MNAIPDAIPNTEQSWGQFLLNLAAEAAADAAQRDSSTVLAETLNDLSLVLSSYAGRLGVERLAVAAEKAPPDVLAEPQLPEDFAEALRAAVVDPPIMASGADDLNVRLTALEALASAPPAPFDLPGWIRETLQDHHERISALELLNGGLLERIAFLENNANLDHIAASPEFVAEAPIDQDDYRPEAWGSIERARQALSNRVKREYARRAATRQTVLNAVIHLASITERSDDDEAQLAQMRGRGDRLSQLDVVRDVKLDEIGALDDLNEARLYAAEHGWPG